MAQRIFYVFLRNLKSQKNFTIINILCLSLGFCFSGLILFYIKNEKSFDKFHENVSSIYRLESNVYNPQAQAHDDAYWRFPSLSDPMIRALSSSAPGIQASSRMFTSFREAIIKYKEYAIPEKITYVENDFFKIFSFFVISGNRHKVFENNSSVVITKTMAEKLFKNEEPIGKIISIDSDGELLYKVAAVIQDPPGNSSINFSVLVPVQSWSQYNDYISEWGEYAYSWFVLIDKNTKANDFLKRINTVASSAMKDKILELRNVLNIPPSVINVFQLSMTPMSAIHWNTKIPWEKTSSIQNVYILSGIAAIIIIVASINFVSILLARASKKGFEVGVRKVNGASRFQILIQFGFESFLMALFAGIIGLLLIFALLGTFNNFTGKDIAIQLSWIDFVFILVLLLITTLMTSLYPGLLLSSFNPASVIKSHFSQRMRIGVVRSLVIVQFSLSVFLAISSTVMFREMNYINNKDLGFSGEHIVSLLTYTNGTESNAVIERFKARALQEPGVSSVTGMSRPFFKGLSNMGFINESHENKSSKAYSVDEDFVSTLKLTLVSGRNFDPRNPADKNAVVINETLAKQIGVNSNDRYIKWAGNSLDSSKVIGIVKDFHFRSMEHSIEPLFLSMNYEKTGPMGAILFRLDGKNDQARLLALQKIWRDVNPGKPYEPQFLENDISKQYESYVRWKNIISASTAFAFVIAAVGLFGLAGINTVNKQKEIGVRKIFGASVLKLLVMLNKQYFIMILISSVLAVPLSFYVMSSWLKNFVYNTTIDWTIFVACILGSTLVVLLAVSYHSIKASIVNPAATIRYE